MSQPIDKTDPDAALILAMAQGESAALETLMDRHLKTIKTLAWHMLGEDMAAEDVAQEVFLKSWIAARNWQPGRAKFITWMRRVATNLCLDRLRKKRELPLPEQDDSAGGRGIDDAISAPDLLTQRESMAQVQSAIAALPERQRAAITLCHYQEMSQIEAARVLEISVHAYESLLSRARRALRARLKMQKTALLDDFGGSPS